MKKEAKKTKLRVKVYLACGKSYVCNLVKKDPPFLGRMLADATCTDLWRMVAIFRGTDLWDKFLRALLRLPEEIWEQHKLRPWYAKRCFKTTEIEKIITTYNNMGDDAKTWIVPNYLDYNSYWTKRVKRFTKQSDWQKAQAELDKARRGLRIYSIPVEATRPRNECLAELAVYVNSLKEKKTRK